MSANTRTMRVDNTKGAPVEVQVFATFRETIAGKRFDFAVTRDISGFGQVLTECRTGRKVCALAVGAVYLPAYAKLRRTAYTARGLIALRQLIDKHGAAHVRAVMESAPALENESAGIA